MIMSVRRPAVRPTVSGHLCCTYGLVTGIEQVVSAKLLGVTFSHNLKFDEHVKNILAICNQRSYLLKGLKGQGLPSRELHTVFCSLIVSRILYTLPASGGFWLLTWLVKLMLICLKPSVGVYCNRKMLSERHHDADMILFRSMLHSTTVFTSYSPIELCANETPHLPLRFCSFLLPL